MREYAGPNTLLKAFQLIRQAIKSMSFTVGDGLSKEGDTLSVTTPVRSIVTQAEFDALPETQRNSGLYVISDGCSGGGGGSAWEVYSTNETRIGTWIDGKPLYRKTVPVSVVSKGNTRIAQPVLTDPSINVVGINGFVDTDFSATDSGRYFVPGIDRLSSGTISFSWYYQPISHTLYIVIFVDRSGTYTGYAHVSYTKTTDGGGST